MTEKKKEYLIDALSELKDNYIAEVVEYQRPNKRRSYWREFGVVAACVVTVAMTSVVFQYLPLERSEDTAQKPESVVMESCAATYTNAQTDMEYVQKAEIEEVREGEKEEYRTSFGISWVLADISEDKINDIVSKENIEIGKNEDEFKQELSVESVVGSASISNWLDAEEIFAQGCDIFQGVVTKRQVYQLTDGLHTYFTILTVEIEDRIRGQMEQGQECTIYLPVVKGKLESSIGGDLSKLDVGSRAIFMPKKADEKSGYGSGDVWFCYADVADYYFNEGMRYLFMETSKGVSYEENVYKIDGGELITLGDVAEYIRNMIAEE